MIKNAFLYIVLILLVSFTPETEENYKATFQVSKGTNIAHWLSQSTRRGQSRVRFFTEKDVKKIKNMGFDHIRIPIDEVQMWDDEGARHDEAFTLLENAINWCKKHKLKAIVDLHILRSHYFNAEDKPLWTDPKEQQKFFDLWKDLSKTLKKFPNKLLAYELMNEAVADDPESWNRLLNKAFSEIRKIEPNRTIIIGSNRWQSVDTFGDLEVPENDPNIILSFHYYKPFLFTHYKTSWTELKDYNGPVNYPGVILSKKRASKLEAKDYKTVRNWVGKKYDSRYFERSMQEPIKKAKKLKLALYCGEFGVFNTAPKKDRLRWFEDLISVFKKNNIGYANWNYKSTEFGLINRDGSENKKIIQIIAE